MFKKGIKIKAKEEKILENSIPFFYFLFFFFTKKIVKWQDTNWDLYVAKKKEIIIKMTDGNTTGTSQHFKNFHSEEYKKAFPDSVN